MSQDSLKKLKLEPMSFDDNILLKLRREFSGQEKYRLFLQQLDRLETQLKNERKLNTELMKQLGTVKELQDQLDEYNLKNIGKTCVKMKTYEKLLRQKKEWEDRFWELHKQLEELKQSIQSPQNTSNETQPTP